MVSELAPVILYLRHVLQPGDLLIIEEPEAHLHPESQLRIARALSDLVGAGLSICLTTHSDLLLQSLSNAVRLTSAGQQQLFPDLASPNGLAPELVTAFLFSPSDDHSFTDVSSIAVSAIEGISDDEFARVTETLYKQTVTVDRLVERTR